MAKRKRSKTDLNTMGLDGLLLYLDTIENIDLIEYTTKNLTYTAKNIIGAVRKGRITINKSKDKPLIEMWEETIDRCFDILEEAMHIVNDRLNDAEIVSSEKANIISLMSEYIKVLNEEETRLEKIEEEEEAKKREEEEALRSVERIRLDGVYLDELVEKFAPNVV